MKPERVVAIWVAVLLACVLGLLGSLVPWPAGLREPWHSSDWAAWVQAIGSILAIAGTAFGTRYQVNRGHELAVREDERRAKRILVGALNHLRALGYSAYVQFLTLNDQLPDRTAVHSLAATSWVDVSMLQMIETQISAIPVFNLPNEISFIPFILAAEIRRGIFLLEETRDKHRGMDSVAFDQFFRLMQSLTADVKLRSDEVNQTCQQLQRELAE